jgi:hypothetical protein
VAGPWAVASAGCFDHGGAVSVSFCSQGSSRAAGRPPWGPALPRPPPTACTREGGRGARPGRLQVPHDVPSLPLPQPPGPRPAVGEGGTGRPQLPPRLASLRDLRAGPLPRRPGNGGAPRLLSAAHPARPRTRSLTPRMHTPGRRRCCAPAGGRAERRARTTAARSRARRRHARAHAGHTRAHKRTHGPCTRGLSTRARTPTHAHRHAQSLYTAPGAHPRATGGPTVGLGTSPPLQRPCFLPGGLGGRSSLLSGHQVPPPQHPFFFFFWPARSSLVPLNS